MPVCGVPTNLGYSQNIEIRLYSWQFFIKRLIIQQAHNEAQTYVYRTIYRQDLVVWFFKQLKQNLHNSSISSELSLQSFSPSHNHDDKIHFPFSQLNNDDDPQPDLTAGDEEKIDSYI